MEQLIVRLGSDNTDSIAWLVWSTSESEIIASGVLPNAESLHSLTERAGQRSVIALCPSSDVLLKWVTLPPRASRKVLAAIPFMLEDELSEDIGELFFATGPKKGEQQAVAIVRHSQMEQWQAQFNNAGLQCDTLIPDVLAVPNNNDGLSILAIADKILVREDEWQGFQGEEDWIVPALSQLTKTAEEPVNINNYSELELSLVPNANVSNDTLELPMAALAKASLAIKFNLFQGDYKIRRQSNSVWKQWRVAAILAGIAFTATLVDKTITLQGLQTQNTHLKTQIDSEIANSFPQARRSRNKRQVISQELTRLEQGGGSASMLTMLNQLTSAFARSNVKPQSLRFDSTRNELRLQAKASNFESLEQFKRAAEAAGFAVEQGAINNRDEGVLGSLSIRSGI